MCSNIREAPRECTVKFGRQYPYYNSVQSAVNIAGQCVVIDCYCTACLAFQQCGIAYYSTHAALVCNSYTCAMYSTTHAEMHACMQVHLCSHKC